MTEKNLLCIVLIVCLILLIYMFSSNSTTYCKVTVRHVNTLTKPVVVSCTEGDHTSIETDIFYNMASPHHRPVSLGVTHKHKSEKNLSKTALTQNLVTISQ